MTSVQEKRTRLDNIRLAKQILYYYKNENVRYSSSKRNRTPSPSRSSKRRQSQSLIPPFCVVDVENAKVKKACAVYACAVLCRMSFENMKNWFKNESYWNERSGVKVEHILICLNKPRRYENV